MTRFTNKRAGFTLIEMMVVMALIAILAVMVMLIAPGVLDADRARDGATQLQVGPFGPGRFVTLRAEMDVIVVLANCPHVLDQRDYVITPVRATAWRGLVTPEADPIRNATPEGLRAFENLEDYLHR